MSARNAILDECDHIVNPRISAMKATAERGAWAARALEIVAHHPDAEEYVDLLAKLGHIEVIKA